MGIKIALGVVAVIGLFIIISFGQEVNRRWQYQQHVDRLEQSVHESEKSVIDLQNLNEYFQTPEYQERVAREKLNFRAPGEKVVLIPNGDVRGSAENTVPTPTPTSDSIPMLWWKAFFVPG